MSGVEFYFAVFVSIEVHNTGRSVAWAENLKGHKKGHEIGVAFLRGFFNAKWIEIFSQ